MPQATDAQRHKVNRDPIRDAHPILLEFQEIGQTTVHRAALNNEDLTRLGEVYSAANIDISLPDSGDAESGISLSVSNITRKMGIAINRARNDIISRVILVDVSDIDGTPLIDTSNMFKISSVQGNSEILSVSLGHRMSLQEPANGNSTSRVLFPGVHFSL